MDLGSMNEFFFKNKPVLPSDSRIERCIKSEVRCLSPDYSNLYKNSRDIRRKILDAVKDELSDNKDSLPRVASRLVPSILKEEYREKR